jgi:hypothetical protein
MAISTSSTKRSPQSISIGNRTFEGVSQFRYLRALVNSQNEISDCINDKIQKRNRAYFANQKFLRVSFDNKEHQS